MEIIICLIASFAVSGILFGSLFLAFYKGFKETDDQIKSFSDFSLQKISELEAKLNELARLQDSVTKDFFDMNDTLKKLRDLDSLDLDCLRVDLYQHLKSGTHLDKNYNFLALKPTIERDFQLNHLEQSVKDRAKKFKIDITTSRLGGL